jgi:TP901 family phage tail tape measure protein
VADKKVSVLLSAKDALSPAFASADKALAKMRKSAGSASEALGVLNKTQGDIKAHQAAQKALKGTNQQLVENKKRVEASSAALREAQAEQRRYQKGIAGAEQTLRELDVELARNGKLTSEQRVAHVRATQSLEQLRPAYKTASAAVAVKRREDKAATREMTSLTAAADKERTRLKSLGSELKKTGLDTKNLTGEQARLSASSAKASAALQKQERRIQSLNTASAKMASNRAVRADLRGQMLGTAIAAAPLVMAGKKAVDYEASWADVQKVANFKDAKQDREVQMAARKQAADLGIGQNDYTDILSAAGQAGVANDKNGNVDPEQLLRFSGDAAKVSVAFDTDAKSAGDMMATIRTSMKLNQSQMMELADVINAESNKMNAKAMTVANVMKRQGANAVLAGFDYKQVAGLASALIASGDTEETGSTALKNITGRLTKGFAATKNQRTSLSMLGFDPGVLAKDMQRNATGTLKKVLTSINQQAPDKQKALISQIFGEEVAGSVAKLAGNMQLLDDAMGIANDKTQHQNSLQNEYLTKAATRNFKIKQTQSRLDDLTISLGNLLLPVVDKLAPAIGSAANGLSDLLKNSETARTVLKGTAIAIGGLIALKATVGTFKFVGTLFSDIAQIGKIGKAKLGGMTDGTAASANRAATALARLNGELDRVGGGGESGNGRGRGRRRNGPAGGAGSDDADDGAANNRNSRRRRRNTRNGRRRNGRGRGSSRVRRLAGKGKSALGAGVSFLWDQVNGGDDDGDDGNLIQTVLKNGSAALASDDPVSTLMDAGLDELKNRTEGVLDTGLNVVNTMETLLPSGASKIVGRVAAPLRVAMGVVDTAEAIKSGDASDVGGAVGGTGGSLGGAAIGAAIGTAILPGIGSVVGGAIGGLAGSELGEKLGEVVGPYIKEGWEGLKGWFNGDDKTTPGKVAKVEPKDLAKVSKDSLTSGIDASVEKAKKDQPPPAPNVSIKIDNSPRFDVKASGDPAQDNALAAKIQAILEVTQTKALHEALAQVSGPDARMNASLSGQRSD